MTKRLIVTADDFGMSMEVNEAVEEAHRKLMLTKAMDLSAKRKVPVKLPLDPADVMAAA